MFFHLLTPLSDFHGIFNLFNYITFRAFSAFLTSFFLTFFFTPIFKRWALSRGIKERIYEFVPEEHQKKLGTPTSGGVVFGLSTLVAVILNMRLDNYFTWISVFTTLSLMSIGFWDDMAKLRGSKKRGLNKRTKLILHFLLALVIYLFVSQKFKDFANKTQGMFFKNIIIDFGILYPLFLFFVFVGATNAVNLTDGLDGLAGGVSLAPLLVFSIIAYIQGNVILSKYLYIIYVPDLGELAIFGASLIGGIVAFLWYNSHPAEIFMGDTGSQLIGGSLAMMSIMCKQEILLALAGGVFVMEAFSVILQVIAFRWKGKRIFLLAPIHHHFEKMGWHESKVVTRFWILSFLFSILAIATLKIR